ncbi:MAG: DNA mismatch repair endonuclease MutL, partial [Chloroflexi bacterium]|nr:DNA mismatch repair endonuclease MutL [Chloroflexota bacterium]
DAPLAVERFATSKIESDRDLQNVRTLGFRGEALPSIGAVSQLEIITRARDEIEGTRVRVVDGQIESEVTGAPIGTQVVVRNLFYNAPARKKFLKSPFRESELIHKTVMQYALAYPHVAFRLVVDGREQLNWAAAASIERVGAVWGRENANEMIPLDHTSMDLNVRGLISRPTIARGSREWQWFYVNGRPIRSGLLAVMLERPYAGRLPPERHPLAVIAIEVNPQFIDVNVHPRKSEVRFYQERAIYGALSHAVEHALREFPITFQQGATDWSFADTPLNATMLYETRAEYYAGPWRALAQLNRTYILAQSGDGLLVVDQHSAQEQVFFERLTAERGGVQQATPVQRPTTMHVMPNEARLLAEHLDEYHSLGIDVEPFGTNTFRITASPSFVKIDPLELLTKLLEEHERHRTLDGDALRDKLASKTACLSAIKAGDALSPEQQQQLLEELLVAYSPATCPHGRPTFVAMTLDEIEQRFLRR